GGGTQKVGRSRTADLDHLRQTQEHVRQEKRIPRGIGHNRGVDGSGGERPFEVYLAVRSRTMHVVCIKPAYASALVVGGSHHQVDPWADTVEEEVDRL